MSTSDIYGNPFSYLTAGVKEPRGSFRSSDAEDTTAAAAEEAGQRRPFSYLAASPQSPLVEESPSSSSLSPYSMSVPDVRGSDAKENKHFDFNSLYRPPPANLTTVSEHSTSGPPPSHHHHHHDEPPSSSSLFSAPLHDGPYTALSYPSTNAHDSLGPESKQHGGGSYSHSHSDDADEVFHKQGGPVVRPHTRESSLGQAYRSSSDSPKDKEGRPMPRWCWVVTVAVVALLCFAVGFVLAWFIQQNVMMPLSGVATVASTTPAATAALATTPPPPPPPPSPNSTTTSALLLNSTTTTTTTTTHQPETTHPTTTTIKTAQDPATLPTETTTTTT